MPTIEEVLGIVAACIAVLTLIGLIHKMLVKPLRAEINENMVWFKKFQRDWDGEPAEPGRDAIAGVMQRLNRIDGELQRNGGNSLKDKVYDTLRATESLEKRIEKIEGKQSQIIESLNDREAHGAV
jgi:hypothetical protein